MTNRSVTSGKGLALRVGYRVFLLIYGFRVEASTRKVNSGLSHG